MKEINFSASTCRYCRFYEPEGRRGGSCQILGVSVESSWKACALASPPFDTTLKKLEDIFQLDTPVIDTPVNRKSNRNVSSPILKIKVEDNLQPTFTKNNFAPARLDDIY